MALNSISDGQPFTYQLLNNIIEEILDLKKAVSKKAGSKDDDEDGAIEVRGPNFNSKVKPMIVFDSVVFTMPENQTGFTLERKFRNNFSNNNPVVVATLVDKDDDGGIPVGYLTITKVNQTSFTMRIKLLRKRNKSTSFQVNYIAIGQTTK